MKLKRLFTLGMALTLSLSLTALPARAVEFDDISEAEWAREYITRMEKEGYAKGYQNEDGSYSFKPNGKMTAAETLLFCARTTGVDADIQDRIAAKWADTLDEILPSANNMAAWAAHDMAVALETGVLTLDELRELAAIAPQTAGTANPRSFLELAMPRERIAMYLVRAMQLEPLAKSLTTYDLKYPDTAQISAELRPYVYVLTNIGIVQGKGTGESAPVFDPQESVTRAEMITMLCRALDFMGREDVDITVELPEYTDYDWASGVIKATSATADGSLVLTLESPLTGESRSYTVPAAAKIYERNMLIRASAVKDGQKDGQFARLVLDDKGTVTRVRLCGELKSANRFTGSVTSLEDNTLTLRADGTDRTFTIDRLTSVMAGDEAGDRGVIDPEAGYTAATVWVDELGHVAAVKLTGGTRPVSGLVDDVTVSGGVTTLTVCAPNGVTTAYTIPDTAVVTTNKAAGSLTATQKGRGVELRVRVDTGEVTSVNVDTVSTYIQGPIRRLGRAGTAQTVVIADRFTGKEVSYPILTDAVITYDGEERTLAQVETGWYATAVVSNATTTNDVIVSLEAYPGSTTVEGVITDIVYATPTVLSVTTADGGVVRQEVDQSAVTITKDGKSGSTITVSSLDKGDSVVLTMTYNVLTKIEATSRKADVTGVIKGFASRDNGTELTVALTDGETKTYLVTPGTTVTPNWNAIYQINASVAMVTDGDDVLSMEVTSAATSNGVSLSGTVYTVSRTGTRFIEVIETGKTTPTRVMVDSSTRYQASANSLTLNSISEGDTLNIYATYDAGTNTYNAWLVVKL